MARGIVRRGPFTSSAMLAMSSKPIKAKKARRLACENKMRAALLNQKSFARAKEETGIGAYPSCNNCQEP